MWQSDVGENTAGELVCHLVEGGRTEVVGRDQGKDGGPGVGRSVHVAEMNFVERRFADAQHQLTFFFQADVGGALDEVRSDAVGNAGQGTDAARHHDHGIGWIRAAGDIGAYIRVGLLVNFAGCVTEKMGDEVVATAQTKFFGHHAQSAVGSDEVRALNASVAVDGQQQMAQEYRSAGAGGGDGQVLR